MKNLSCGIIAQPNSSFSVIYSNYCLRNGGFTTTAFSLRPRMSMQISVPTLLYSGLIYPIPIPILRIGRLVKFFPSTNLVIHPKPASMGEVVSSKSLPYKQKPISRRSVSRAPRPTGLMPNSAPASNTASQIFMAASG